MNAIGQGKFEKRLRLTRGSDFERVYKKGRRVRNTHFTVFFDGNQLSYSRFGLTVSKKLGTAVRRNRIKRIFREALRCHQGEAMPGFDFVFNPHPSAAALKATALADDLVALFSRLKGKYHESADIRPN